MPISRPNLNDISKRVPFKNSLHNFHTFFDEKIWQKIVKIMRVNTYLHSEKGWQAIIPLT
jgi:hypothetical protein